MQNIVQGSGFKGSVFRGSGSGLEMLIACTIAKLQRVLIAIVYACID